MFNELCQSSVANRCQGFLFIAAANEETRIPAFRTHLRKHVARECCGAELRAHRSHRAARYMPRLAASREEAY